MNTTKKKIINILICGATYKSNCDDIRNSPALEIINKIILIKKTNLKIFDPYVKKSKNLININFLSKKNFRKEIKKQDLLVFLVSHDEYKHIITKSLAKTSILDFS